MTLLQCPKVAYQDAVRVATASSTVGTGSLYPEKKDVYVIDAGTQEPHPGGAAQEWHAALAANMSILIFISPPEDREYSAQEAFNFIGKDIS